VDEYFFGKSFEQLNMATCFTWICSKVIFEHTYFTRECSDTIHLACDGHPPFHWGILKHSKASASGGKTPRPTAGVEIPLRVKGSSAPAPPLGLSPRPHCAPLLAIPGSTYTPKEWWDQQSSCYYKSTTNLCVENFEIQLIFEIITAKVKQVI